MRHAFNVRDRGDHTQRDAETVVWRGHAGGQYMVAATMLGRARSWRHLITTGEHGLSLRAELAAARDVLTSRRHRRRAPRRDAGRVTS